MEEVRRHFFIAVKFVLFFFCTFIVGRLIKIPLSSMVYNESSDKIPYQIFFIYASIPNVLFYTAVGFALSLFMKKRIMLWLILFCLIELLWQNFFEKPIFGEANIFTYLSFYVPRYIMPFALLFGAWISNRTIKRKNNSKNSI